jgi:hypothetical protein
LFPLVVLGSTEVSEKWAYSLYQTYSLHNVADIVAYAAARSIDVIAEIDTPGHTAVILESHPEHLACTPATSWTSFASGRFHIESYLRYLLTPIQSLMLVNFAWIPANLLLAAAKLLSWSVLLYHQ